jgi:HD-like signal output (HDOD) protein
MFGWFRRRLARSTPAVATMTSAPVRMAPQHRPSPDSAFMPPGMVAPAPANVPVSVTALAPNAPAAPSEPVESARDRYRATLRRHLRAELAERARAITADLGRAPHTEEVRAVLERVVHADDHTLRPIPTAAQRALRLARHPLSNLQDVAEAFERDPSLAEGLMRMANSAWYRVGDTEVDSLHEALKRTGSSGAEAVILKHSLHRTLCRPGGACEAMTSQVWLHLTRTATIARELAHGFALDPEAAYLLGLLHDAGKLVLFDTISERRRRTRTASPLPFSLLRRMLGELHEPLGGLALLHWGLDPDLAAAVADHHRRATPRLPHAAAELLFVAERADLALSTGARADAHEWIAHGGLVLEAETLERACARATDGALRFVRHEDGALSVA